MINVTFVELQAFGTKIELPWPRLSIIFQKLSIRLFSNSPFGDFEYNWPVNIDTIVYKTKIGELIQCYICTYMYTEIDALPMIYFRLDEQQNTLR